MHEGEMSAGFDETETAEKSITHDVREGSENDRLPGRTCIREIIKQADTSNKGRHKDHELAVVVHAHLNQRYVNKKRPRLIIQPHSPQFHTHGQ